VVLSLCELIKSLKLSKPLNQAILDKKRPATAVAKPSNDKPIGLTLCIEKCRLSHKNTDLLFEHLSNAPALKSLSLTHLSLQLVAMDVPQDASFSRISHGPLVQLLSSRQCHISFLNLSSNKLGLDACLNLCQALILNHTLAHPLRKLNLSRNCLGPKGMKLLAECLRDNTSIKSLNVSYNKIGDEGAIGVAKMIQA